MDPRNGLSLSGKFQILFETVRVVKERSHWHLAPLLLPAPDLIITTFRPTIQHTDNLGPLLLSPNYLLAVSLPDVGQDTPAGPGRAGLTELSDQSRLMPGPARRAAKVSVMF
eukprot:453070-Hanusia_phi.AAC.3